MENVPLMYDLSEAFNAMSLRHACISFILEKYDELSALPWYVAFSSLIFLVRNMIEIGLLHGRL